jgi:hypothetical protein
MHRLVLIDGVGCRVLYPDLLLYPSAFVARIPAVQRALTAQVG